HGSHARPYRFFPLRRDFVDFGSSLGSTSLVWMIRYLNPLGEVNSVSPTIDSGAGLPGVHDESVPAAGLPSLTVLSTFLSEPGPPSRVGPGALLRVRRGMARAFITGSRGRLELDLGDRVNLPNHRHVRSEAPRAGRRPTGVGDVKEQRSLDEDRDGW